MANSAPAKRQLCLRVSMERERKEGTLRANVESGLCKVLLKVFGK